MKRDPEIPFQIVVGFDFSDLGKLALAESLGLAALNAKTVLHIVTVLEHHRGVGPIQPKSRADYHTADEVQDQVRAVVEDKVARYTPAQFQFYIHARFGNAAKEILKVASEAGADLIVVGNHGSESRVGRWLIGSAADRITRHAMCPVLIMRPKETGGPSEELGDSEDMSPEAACPRCVAARRETDGAQWWCDECGKPYAQPHRYSYTDGVRPTGNKDWSVFNR